MYAVLTIAGWVLWRGAGRYQGLVGLGTYAFSLSATLFTLYLYYLEVFEINAFCTWCVISSIVTFTLLVLTSANLSTPGHGKHAKKRKPARRFRLSDYIQW